jgi:serine/threonine-protein kinase
MATQSTLGSYPIERELGRGGMGVVYLARDPRLNRLVAIKVLPDGLALNPDSLARFDCEARLLASLDGRVLAIQDGEGEGDVTSYNVVVNWTSELLARMGPRAR